ncbi:uncharacterized protein SAPINGB_P001111 [Magnusiomyces paraingens]|uniref:C2H2-type domain-containing protein n=1 Tax=Magnusiomyces paraingens TaxID=2606893 RepID=A0A5E8BAC2_9ASCO|nr:uncharacterized protein SAPINGB_P001111 [Saprochaete ingens]VVT46231.1 unnamed protein product [Saprochaete ingens]
MYKDNTQNKNNLLHLSVNSNTDNSISNSTPVISDIKSDQNLNNNSTNDTLSSFTASLDPTTSSSLANDKNEVVLIQLNPNHYHTVSHTDDVNSINAVDTPETVSGDNINTTDLEAFTDNLLSLAGKIDIDGSVNDKISNFDHKDHSTGLEASLNNEEQYINSLGPVLSTSDFERYQPTRPSSLSDPSPCLPDSETDHLLDADIDQTTQVLMQIAQSTLQNNTQQTPSELDIDSSGNAHETGGMIVSSVQEDLPHVLISGNDSDDDKTDSFSGNNPNALNMIQYDEPDKFDQLSVGVQPESELTELNGTPGLKKTKSNFQNVCQFCGHVFSHSGSLGRHLDLKRGTRLHPADQIDLIRADVKRRGDVMEVRARRAKRAKEYNSREDVRERARARRKMKDLVHRSREQARQNFFDRIGTPHLPPHPSFAYVVLYFLPPALWPHDPPTSQTLEQLKQALEPLREFYDNKMPLEEYTNKINVAYEQWSLMNKDSRMEIWNREQRRVAEAALGSLSLHDLGSRDLWLDMEEQRISKLEEDHHNFGESESSAPIDSIDGELLNS